MMIIFCFGFGELQALIIHTEYVIKIYKRPTDCSEISSGIFIITIISLYAYMLTIYHQISPPKSSPQPVFFCLNINLSMDSSRWGMFPDGEIRTERSIGPSTSAVPILEGTFAYFDMSFKSFVKCLMISFF